MESIHIRNERGKTTLTAPIFYERIQILREQYGSMDETTRQRKQRALAEAIKNREEAKMEGFRFAGGTQSSSVL